MVFGHKTKRPSREKLAEENAPTGSDVAAGIAFDTSHSSVKYSQEGGGYHGRLRSYHQDSTFSGQTLGFSSFRVSVRQRGTQVFLFLQDG